jgi:hypothetical protein
VSPTAQGATQRDCLMSAIVRIASKPRWLPGPLSAMTGLVHRSKELYALVELIDKATEAAN